MTYNGHNLLILPRSAIALFASAIFFCTASCGVLPAQLPSYRYRLAVEIDTPDGVKTGSSIVEINSSQESTLNIDNPRGLIVGVVGEAVAVDLPHEQTLFALLRPADPSRFGPDNAAFFAQTALLPDNTWDGVTTYKLILDKMRHNPGIGILDPKDYPLLVRFKNIDRPSTVELVDPTNLSASFGAGYRIRRITVQITNAPVTTGIAKHFKWWSAYKDRFFDGSYTVSEDMRSPALSSHLTSRSFTQ